MLSDIRLLIVEDDANYMELIIRRLKRYGYTEIDQARSVDEARSRMGSYFYDVIVTDMRLDDDSNGGFEVMEEVEKKLVTSVVIVLTANDSVPDCRRALRGGRVRCWDYISKMLTGTGGSALDDLCHSIQMAVDHHHGHGSRLDSDWIEESLDQLQRAYPDQFVAVLNKTVIAYDSTETGLKVQLRDRDLPLFLPLIRKISTHFPRDISVETLVERGIMEEGPHLEFKSTLLWDINREVKNEQLCLSVLKTIAGFCNTNGGTLLIGVRDAGEICGIENDFGVISSRPQRRNRDGFLLYLRNEIESKIGKIFQEYIQCRFESVQGKTVCAVDVSRTPEPAFVLSKGRKDFYVRHGNRTTPMNVEEMYRHFRSRRQF